MSVLQFRIDTEHVWTSATRKTDRTFNVKRGAHSSAIMI